MGVSAILVMSVLTEAVITYIKTWVVEKKIQWQMIASVMLSIVVCFAYGLDIPALVGIDSSIPFIGNVITGILVSRGSNYIYDLFKTLKINKSSTEVVGGVGSDASDGVEI